jgi:hypothetical protein
MTNKPLDCTGTTGPVGKCDIVDDPQGNKLDHYLNAIRALGYDVTLAVGAEPEAKPSVRILTEADIAAIKAAKVPPEYEHLDDEPEADKTGVGK